ncbi:hypothetical protein K7X08_000511 [Anisodus acutangulus]|uniref:Uncharacterized protein n=1 Tax=Anisodus acutangulus TaxID=402998 RepID=A0A9Q1RDK8_9SOLA|nr:hypothetical protein K7X08_000511 [Anisodus acutangulus]
MEVVEANPLQLIRAKSEKDRIKVKRKTLEAVLQECQRAIELLSTTGSVEDDSNSNSDVDTETDELRDLLKSRVECPDFLQKLENAQASVPQNLVEEGSSWDMVNENDLWEGGNPELDGEDYVLVRQEDIVDGIACFMAAYLLSLKQTKVICFLQPEEIPSIDLTPNQLQDALSKTFSLKKKKGKLRKAWNGSKVIYNVASWGATAIGIYQNPAILRAASVAFWTSCRVISKLF